VTGLLAVVYTEAPGEAQAIVTVTGSISNPTAERWSNRPVRPELPNPAANL
jgi:hypothetical protein